MTFEAPNFTAVPNFLIEKLMRLLTPAQMKTMLVILRFTTVFHRRRAAIPISKFIEFTGLSKQGVINSTKGLQEKGWIKVYRGNNRTTSEFEILIKNDTSQPSGQEDKDLVN